MTDFCVIPQIRNGTTIDVKPGSFVSPGFRVRIVCDVGFRVTSQWKWVLHEKGVSQTRTHNEIVCLEGGRWNMDVSCRWGKARNSPQHRRRRRRRRECFT